MKRPGGKTFTDSEHSPATVRRAYNACYGSAPFGDSPRYYRWLAQRAVPEPVGTAPHAAPPRVLDAGCGSGLLLAALAEARPGARLFGLDLSDEALRQARAYAGGAALVLAQGERIPFGDDSFDVVLCSGNLEHYLDPAAGARELARVCRPRGHVWVLLPNSYYSGDLWRVITTGYGPNHHQVIDRFATVNEWRDLLDANGLTVESITPYNRFKWWKRLMPRNLAYHFLYCTRPNANRQQ